MPLRLFPLARSSSSSYVACRYKHTSLRFANSASKVSIRNGSLSIITLPLVTSAAAADCRLLQRSYSSSRFVTNMKMTQVNGERTVGISSSGGMAKSHNESLRDVCRSMNGKVKAFLERKTTDNRLKGAQEQARIALEVIRKSLEDFRLNELALSFNGGKDCLVLLILYLSVLHDFFEVPSASSTTSSTSTSSANGSSPQPRRPSYSAAAPYPLRLHTVYVTSTHPFREVDEFVDVCVDTYHLNLVRYSGVGIKQAFEKYLHDNSEVKAIFVGTRRTDPHGALLKHFDPTDHGWPEFLRVHPVIDWHYADVWTFLRAIDIPYCCLYDQGYTSLGGKTDTHPNPALSASNGVEKFRPAYELMTDEEERLGRD